MPAAANLIHIHRPIHVGGPAGTGGDRAAAELQGQPAAELCQLRGLRGALRVRPLATA